MSECYDKCSKACITASKLCLKEAAIHNLPMPTHCLCTALLAVILKIEETDGREKAQYVAAETILALMKALGKQWDDEPKGPMTHQVQSNATH